MAIGVATSYAEQGECLSLKFDALAAQSPLCLAVGIEEIGMGYNIYFSGGRLVSDGHTWTTECAERALVLVTKHCKQFLCQAAISDDSGKAISNLELRRLAAEESAIQHQLSGS